MWRIRGRGYLKFVDRSFRKGYAPIAENINGKVRICRRRFGRAQDALNYLDRWLDKVNGVRVETVDSEYVELDEGA